MTPEEKKERQRGYSRAYYQRHKESEKKRSKAWHKAHPGYRTKKTREFRIDNPDYWREWAAEHRENLRDSDKRHREKDPESYRLRQALAARARRKQRNEGT